MHEASFSYNKGLWHLLSVFMLDLGDAILIIIIILYMQLLKKQCARQIEKTASPVEHLRLALQQVNFFSVPNILFSVF